MSVKRILYAPRWVPTIDIQHIREAILAHALDGVVVWQERV